MAAIIHRVFVVKIMIELVEYHDIGKRNFVSLQFRFNFAPTVWLHKLEETFDEFIFGCLAETAPSEMFYDRIHMSHVLGTEPHFKCVAVYFGSGY